MHPFIPQFANLGRAPRRHKLYVYGQTSDFAVSGFEVYVKYIRHPTMKLWLGNNCFLGIWYGSHDSGEKLMLVHK